MQRRLAKPIHYPELVFFHLHTTLQISIFLNVAKLAYCVLYYRIPIDGYTRFQNLQRIIVYYPSNRSYPSIRIKTIFKKTVEPLPPIFFCFLEIFSISAGRPWQNFFQKSSRVFDSVSSENQ